VADLGTTRDRRLAGVADKRPDLRSILRVEPGQPANLAEIDTRATHGYEKDAAAKVASRDLDRLEAVQEVIWAEHRRRVLIVLQGIDASGKDGTIGHVMSAFNPLGCRAVPFGVPTGSEQAHDYLWRIHAQVPGDGEIVIFNRSHYESVLVERVDELVPEAVWSRRYDQINAFERLLVEEGTTIIKLFLHISKDEQLERFKARLDDPEKRWKFRTGDLTERTHWDAYQRAFEDALTRTSTEAAPWYIVPADRKWFRDLAVGEIVAASLEALHPRYPDRDDLPTAPDLA
jgi:PPK2 family polyphosphate:nucleotide phosphotransferase